MFDSFVMWVEDCSASRVEMAYICGRSGGDAGDAGCVLKNDVVRLAAGDGVIVVASKSDHAMS